MKRLVSVVLCVICILSSVSAFADTYSVEEILPSISTFSDEDLATLLSAVTEEQEARTAALAAEQAQAKAASENAIMEEEEFIERPTVQRGDKNDDAKAIQERLIELGFLNGSADGDFGKKSEAALKQFQAANGLEETGIADSMTQHILYSQRAVDKTTYNNRPIAIGDGWEITKEYRYNTRYDNYYILVLKNTSGYNAEIRINVTFYDENNNIIGVEQASEDACENDCYTYWSFSNDNAFDHATYTISMSPEKYYADGTQSCLEITTSIVGSKVILSAKNNGSKAVQFVEYHVIYLDDDGEVVGTDWGYITDDDSEIKPGAIEMREESIRDDFSDVLVYVHGRANK